MLNLPDFRASERTYQLLTQVAEEGRHDKPGELLFKHTTQNTMLFKMFKRMII